MFLAGSSFSCRLAIMEKRVERIDPPEERALYRNSRCGSPYSAAASSLSIHTHTHLHLGIQQVDLIIFVADEAFASSPLLFFFANFLYSFPFIAAGQGAATSYQLVKKKKKTSEANQLPLYLYRDGLKAGPTYNIRILQSSTE